jgi:hypothetical protein
VAGSKGVGEGTMATIIGMDHTVGEEATIAVEAGDGDYLSTFHFHFQKPVRILHDVRRRL